MRVWKHVVAGVVCASLAVALWVPRPVQAAAPAGCLLFMSGREAAPSQDCLGCHESHAGVLGATHPVDLDYRAAATRARGGLRAFEETVKRGVFLPDGQLRCASCHEARSSWKYHLAIPPGAAVARAVNPRDATTYASPAAAARLRGGASERIEPGAAVTPTPLCLACHAYD